MKLKNISIKNGKSANLRLEKEDKIYLVNEEFEIDNERAKQLLKIQIDGNPIVEKVKEVKTSQADNNQES